eukprot:g2532.t1
MYQHCMKLDEIKGLVEPLYEMDLNAAVDVLIRLIPDRKMVNKDYQLWSYPEPPEDVLDLDRKWPTSPEQLAWCDSRRKRDWKEISYEEYMKWPWWSQAGSLIREWFVRCVHDKHAVYKKGYNNRVSGFVHFVKQLQIYSGSLQGVFREGTSPNDRNDLPGRYRDRGVRNFCILLLYECTEWSHIKPKGYVVTAEKYIDIFQSYACARLLRAALYMYEIDPKSLSKTLFAELYNILPDGSRKSDRPAGLFTGCKISPYGTIQDVLDHLRHLLRDKKKSHLINFMNAQHITMWMCFEESSEPVPSLQC